MNDAVARSSPLDDLAYANTLPTGRRREIREAVPGVSRAVLALEVGCTEQTIMRWENNRPQPMVKGKRGVAYGAALRRMSTP